MKPGHYPLVWGKPDPRAKGRKIWIKVGRAFVKGDKLSIVLDAIPFGFESDPILSAFDHSDDELDQDTPPDGYTGG